MADSPVNVIKRCEEYTHIYPVRLALTTNRLKAIADSTTPLITPQGLPQAGNDYELRRLRSGYIYILAFDVAEDGDESCFMGDKHLFAYRYYSPEIEGNEANYAYQFEQLFFHDNSIEPNLVHKKALVKPYISLPRIITQFDIFYSDMLLPAELLKALASGETAKGTWLRSVKLSPMEGSVAKLTELTELVRDFHPDEPYYDSHEENKFRFTAVGRLRVKLGIPITDKGYIVAVEDPVGTARDLAAFHTYLSVEREKLLDKYEYAITTAQIIKAYVQQEHIEHTYQETKKRIDNASGWEKLSHWGLAPPEVTRMSLEQSYQSLRKFIHPQHLTEHSHNEIFAALKTELQLEQDIPGINAIEKMANITGLYGRHFKKVVDVQVDFVDKHRTLFDSLAAIFMQNPQAVRAAECWCLYHHGLYAGIDVSPYGYNALTEAYYEDMPETAQRKGSQTVATLRQHLSAIGKVLPALETVAKNDAFKIITYDLFTEVLIPSRLAAKLSNKKSAKGRPDYVLWRRVFEVNPLTKEVVSRGTGTIVLPNSDMHYKKYQLQVHYLEPNYRPFYLSGGLAKLLSYEAVIGLFSDKKKYKTWEGQFANDPLLATIMMFAGHQAPAGGIEKAMLQAKDELINIADIKRNRSSKALIYRFFSQTPKMPPQISIFTQIKAALLNANSGLTLFSGLVEYGVYTESRYRGDKIGANAALLRGFGGVSVGTAYGALGLFAHNGVLANLAVLGLQGMLLVGAIALVAGVVMGFFSQKEMEAWIENGFWGTSEMYWGEAKGGYEWNAEREKLFKNQLKKSELVYRSLNNGERELEINAETIFEKYTIEMQRYFQFKEPIKLSKYESNSILVEHSSLMNPAMAQTIRISTLIVNTYWRCDNPVFSVEYLKEGRAVLHFSFPLNVRVNTHDDENISDSIPENEVKEMRIAISMADYQHSDKRFYSKLQVIKIT